MLFIFFFRFRNRQKTKDIFQKQTYFFKSASLLHDNQNLKKRFHGIYSFYQVVSVRSFLRENEPASL